MERDLHHCRGLHHRACMELDPHHCRCLHSRAWMGCRTSTIWMLNLGMVLQVNGLGSLWRSITLRTWWKVLIANIGDGKSFGNRNSPEKLWGPRSVWSMANGCSFWRAKWRAWRRSWRWLALRPWTRRPRVAGLQHSPRAWTLWWMILFLRTSLSRLERCYKPIQCRWPKSRRTSTCGRSRCRPSWRLWWALERFAGWRWISWWTSLAMTGWRWHRRRLSRRSNRPRENGRRESSSVGTWCILLGM